MRIRNLNGVRPLRDRESGQATTEFALILLPLLLLVSGIIWFGIGLNFWLDMQRIANQGARWAVVNCGPAPQSALVCNPNLQTYLSNLRSWVIFVQGAIFFLCVLFFRKGFMGLLPQRVRKWL